MRPQADNQKEILVGTARSVHVQYLAVADPGFLKGGFSFSLTKTPAQFELKTTKKKGHQPSYFSLGNILHLLLIKLL